MDIIKGKILCAKKVVIYGPEGIGKSTFASRFPNPLFIDTEGSTKEMDVARTPEPSSWTMLMEQISYVAANPDICKTLIIDTIDWAEQMCVEHVCSTHQKNGIEDFGYGNGYVYTKEEFGRFLNRLSDVVKKGVHVVLTAHAQMRKFEQPDELGAYDRWELKLGKKTASQISPIVKEWADMVLFANYKTYSVAVDDKGKKHKAQGGKRVMYTTHHPCWDAKNRYGLPDEMEFDYNGIAHIFSDSTTHSVSGDKQNAAPEKVTPVQQKPDSGNKAEQKADTEPTNNSTDAGKLPEEPKEKGIKINNKIPRELQDLMIAYQVDEWDIQEVVAAKGYYPNDTPVENYDPAFIKGVLVGAWNQVYSMIQNMKKTMNNPFDKEE